MVVPLWSRVSLHNFQPGISFRYRRRQSPSIVPCVSSAYAIHVSHGTSWTTWITCENSCQSRNVKKSSGKLLLSEYFTSMCKFSQIVLTGSLRKKNWKSYLQTTWETLANSKIKHTKPISRIDVQLPLCVQGGIHLSPGSPGITGTPRTPGAPGSPPNC